MKLSHRLPDQQINQCQQQGYTQSSQCLTVAVGN